MELNEGKMGISPPVVPMIREETVIREIIHGMVGFPGSRTILSPLANMFLVITIKIICSDHKKKPP